jgi:hypothetical protein
VALRNELAPGVRIEVGISTAFGCTLQGAVPEDEVICAGRTTGGCGRVDECGLSDTTGMANPAQVRRLFTRLQAAIGDRAGAAHMHNTRGLGLANCLAAFDVGVRTFDSSLGGLGGCPYAPGASGNVVTEDLVFMFEAMGVGTGVDLDTPDGRAQRAACRPARRAALRHDTRGRPAAGFRDPTAVMTDPTATPTGADKLPLAGLRVVEFTHMVMGPTCGMILADLGAEVIKVEPLAGDSTRRLLGSGAGFFACSTATSRAWRWT